METPLKSLEDVLVERGRVSADDLRKVRRLQEERGERIEKLLLDLGFISEEDLLPVFSEHLGVPLVGRSELPDEPIEVPNLNIQFLRNAKILPVAVADGVIRMAMTDPADRDILQGLEVATGCRVAPLLAKEKDIIEALESCYGGADTGGDDG
ncbi:MAG: hypothetical protein ABGY42_17190, partial [bacterium]